MFERAIELPAASGGSGASSAASGGGAAAGVDGGAPTRQTATTTTTVYAMLSKIKRAKYPAVTPEEEAVSVPLQTLYLAVFDAAMLRVVTSAAPDTWLSVKRALTSHMVDGKDLRLIHVLEDAYGDMDVMCLQVCLHSRERAM
jgi:hypothetical protein